MSGRCGVPSIDWHGDRFAHDQCAHVGYRSGVIVKHDTGGGGIYPDILEGPRRQGACSFAIPAVPRARLEQMFFNAEAELLIPAAQKSAA